MTSKPTMVETLRDAWAEYQRHGVDKHGLEFGKKLFELRKDSEVVQGGTSFSAALDETKIPRSTAYFWLSRYEESIGWEKLHKEKRQHRGDMSFDDTKKAAFDIISDGFKSLIETEPEKGRLLQAAKDWMHAKLKSPAGAAPSKVDVALIEGMVVVLNGVRNKVVHVEAADAMVSRMDGCEAAVIYFQPIEEKSTQGTKTKPVDPKKDLLKRFYAARRAMKFFTTMLGEARFFVDSKPEGMGSSYGEFLEEYPSADKYLLKPPTKDYTLPKTIEELEAEDKKAFEEFQKVFQEGKAMGVLTMREEKPKERKATGENAAKALAAGADLEKTLDSLEPVNMPCKSDQVKGN